MHAIACLVISLMQIAGSAAGNWFSSRLMRNAGILNDTATSADQCIAKCASTTGCSAISWQQMSGTCLKSMCNSLDFYKTTGWNSYVMYQTFAETVDFPSAHMEWMLTDTCGSKNSAAGLGPKMNLYSTTYTSSASVYAGNSVSFSGSASSYGQTDSDVNVNNPMYTTSLTVMLWVYFNTVVDRAALLEFSVGSKSRGIIFWMVRGIYYDWNYYFGTNCTGACFGTMYSWTPTPNTWNHIVYVYDATLGRGITYLNASLVAVTPSVVVRQLLTWDTVTIATSVFNETMPLNGSGFCYKVFDAALTSDQIWRISQSCLTSKLRLSG